ncbi:Nif3-like dinuclear metal center hexameric protein [Lapidilactobacillus bayanensis]|uniref:Nif3-like dinuclear metal center hexameric protein n=1 Tax=Lapidilactobacillus bayanensis TaxID=2485998 RepID=UPI000F799137|nr:Nif3-like dinuclear metal center hexameric protein [Lapidilactobacillus bayanensis]
MRPTVQQIIDQIEAFAPPRYAEQHDPIGLQIGNRAQIVHKVLVTLDVRPEVVQEAIDNQIDLILAHHPLMFHPAPHLDYKDSQQKMYMDLIQQRISVFAAHTNLDETPGGMNDWLAEKVGLRNIRPFNPRPKDFTEPTIYLGTVGELTEPQSVLEFAQDCKTIFNVSGLRLTTHQPGRLVKRVAIIGGDGGKFYREALLAKADVLITGDVYYHTAHEMLADGLSVIDPGHHIESVIVEKLPPLLEQWQQQHDWQFEIQVSQVNTDPFQFI